MYNEGIYHEGIYHEGIYHDPLPSHLSPLRVFLGNPGVTLSIPGRPRGLRSNGSAPECGKYQSHSVTLPCVDRDSYQSRLGLTAL